MAPGPVDDFSVDQPGACWRIHTVNLTHQAAHDSIAAKISRERLKYPRLVIFWFSDLPIEPLCLFDQAADLVRRRRFRYSVVDVSTH